VRDACNDVEAGQVGVREYDELRVVVMKDLMLYLAHRDMTMHADGLTRLSKTYEKVMIVRTPEMEEIFQQEQAHTQRLNLTNHGSVPTHGGGSHPISQPLGFHN